MCPSKKINEAVKEAKPFFRRRAYFLKMLLHKFPGRIIMKFMAAFKYEMLKSIAETKRFVISTRL